VFLLHGLGHASFVVEVANIDPCLRASGLHSLVQLHACRKAAVSCISEACRRVVMLVIWGPDEKGSNANECLQRVPGGSSLHLDDISRKQGVVRLPLLVCVRRTEAPIEPPRQQSKCIMAASAFYATSGVAWLSLMQLCSQGRR